MSCCCSTTDLRARDPRTPFVRLSAQTRAPKPQPRPNRNDTLVTDLRLSCDVLRPISDRPTAWARPPRVTCVTRQNLLEIKKNSRVTCDRFTTVPKDIRGHQMDYDQPAKTCDQRRIQLRIGSLAIETYKLHDRFLTVKSGRRACRFQWRVGPSYCEYSRVTYDLLVSNIGGTYDIADQLPSNREFGHFWS